MRRNLILILFVFVLTDMYSQVMKYKTTEVDIEKPGVKTVTKYEVCYHTLDFDNNLLIFDGINAKGVKTKISYKMQKAYQEGVTYVIVINSNGLREFWISPVVNNLGYDMMDGTRLAMYNMEKLK